MKDVTAAVIVRGNQVFLARRAPGENFAGGWEFPGGKVEDGESPEQCLRRELLEELGVKAEVRHLIGESIYHYGRGAIRLLAYRVDLITEEVQLRVHDDCRWVEITDLLSCDLLPADVPIAQKLMEGCV